MGTKSKLNLIYQDWLRSLPDVNKISEQFLKLTSNVDRADLVIGLFENNPCEVFVDSVGKNNVAAKEIREAGNRKYAASLYSEALYYYTKSVAFAVSDSQELALALGNRAACLLNLGNIAEALVDVQRALAIPAIDPDYSDKLLKRQDVCINRIIESKEPSNGRTLPLLENTSDYFDSTSDKVMLGDSETLGRHLRAKHSVTTGEVVAVEVPYSSVLLPARYYSHCSLCFLHAPALIECPQCTTAMYCSTDCLIKDKKKHEFECKVVERLAALPIEKMELLALRILIDALCEGCCVGALLERLPNSGAVTDSRDDTYRCLDIRRIYDLIGNTEKRSVSDLFRRAFTACIIVQALKKYSKLFEEYSINASDAGGFIFHFLQSLPCNAHEITQMIEREGVEVGAGAFATLSLLNHSCDPNVVRQSIGNTVVLRAIRPIKPAEEVGSNQLS